MDRIHTAMQTKRALSFVPFDYGPDRQPVASGPAQVVSPKGLLWWAEGYHLLGWDHRAKHLALYRPDRMTQVLVEGSEPGALRGCDAVCHGRGRWGGVL